MAVSSEYVIELAIDLEQSSLDVVVHEVDALSLLAVVQALLRDVQWRLQDDVASPG